MFQNVISHFKEQLQAQADTDLKMYREDHNMENAPYIGIEEPILRQLLEDWHTKHIKNKLSHGEQVVLAFELIGEAYEEEKTAGIILLSEYLYPSGGIDREQVLPHIVNLFTQRRIYDREICDLFSNAFLAKVINDEEEGAYWASNISDWHKVDNKWLARASVLAFRKVERQSDYLDLLYDACKVVIKRREETCKEAVGQLLRDVHVHDPDWVENFILDHIRYFDWNSLNEALKTIPYEDRKTYLKRFKDMHFRNVN
jgi:3-methyladenine DNA glycosylase AlkD